MVPIHFSLLVLTSLVSASSVLAATADHQQCYKIKDSAAATAYLADLLPTDGAFPMASGCELKARAKLLCIDVEKTNVTPAPPGADEGLPAQKSLCYKVKCPSPASPIISTETDQFGVHVVEAKKSFLLCAPIPAPAPGSCGTAGDCSLLANATVACVASTCVIGSCNAGFADCDSTTSTGCEVNTQSDASNCGTCAAACSLPNATASCTAGTCTIDSCDPGFGDCDIDAGTGCEVNTQTDPNNCGSCGNVVDTTTDEGNCGGCGVTCSNPNGSAQCVTGDCIVICNSGFGDCDGSTFNGCEANTTANPMHCGACNNVCTGGTPNCVGSTCVP